jgi:hypothetical protein
VDQKQFHLVKKFFFLPLEKFFLPGAIWAARKSEYAIAGRKGVAPNILETIWNFLENFEISTFLG